MTPHRLPKSLGVAIGFVAIAGLIATSAQSSGAIVSLSSGQVRGVRLAGGGDVFKGIPYAAAPIGDLRWREPQPVEPWAGVRDATAFGPPCPQHASATEDARRQSMAARAKEDCLFLNVWTPGWPVRSRLPVLVSIHGGSHIRGDASTDFASLARYGVVVLSIQYRLGQLGFLAHPELTRESPHRASGNYALLDQIAALRWVRENIARFGGDAANVTAEGHSTGAHDITLLMTSPLARSLFHRAIVRSGPPLGPLGVLGTLRTLAEAERDGESLAASAKTPAGASLAHLRGLTAADIQDASPNWTPGRYPSVDGYALPALPAVEFAQGRQLDVPMLIGSAARDYPGAPVSPDIDALRDAFGPLAERAIALYDARRPESWTTDPTYGSRAEQWATDRTFRCGAVQLAVRHAQAGHPVYQYQFSRLITPGNAHGVETPYLFGPLEPTSGDIDRALATTLQQYFTNFAKTGDPNGSTLPEWPRFDPSRRAFVEFTDRGPIAGEGLRRAQCDLLFENAKRLQ